MRLFVWIILLTFTNVQAETLLERLRSAHPYHLSIEKEEVSVECKKLPRRKEEKCSLVTKRYKDSSELENLLKDVEKEKDVNGEQFLNTEVGKEYKTLKNFLEIQGEFSNCSKDSGFKTADRVDELLGQTLLNISGLSAQRSCKEERKDESELEKLDLSLKDIVEGSKPNLLSEFEKKVNEKSIAKSLEARILFEKKFSPDTYFRREHEQDLLGNICGNICSDLENEMIIKEIFQNKKQAQEIFSFSEDEIYYDVNDRVRMLNTVLETYQQTKKKLRDEWDKEDKEYKNSNARQKQIRDHRVGSKRRKILKDLKKQTYDNFNIQYAALHDGHSGELLQTNLIKDKTGIDKIQKLRSKFFGFGGVTEESLDTLDDFEPLTPIVKEDIPLAVSEAMSRTEKQVRDILSNEREREKLNEAGLTPKKYLSKRSETLEKLFYTNPLSVADVLSENPEYAASLCNVASDIAKKERNESILETGAYIVVGGGFLIATVATFGGALTIPAMVGTAAAGLTFTAADYVHHVNKKNEALAKREAVLNAYFSDAGDSKSVKDINDSWRSYAEADANANLILKLGVFDLLAIPSAARAGAFLRFAKQIDNIDLKLEANSKLLKLVASNDDYIKSLRALQKNYPKGRLGNFLGKLALLSKDKQIAVLEKVGKLKEVRTMNLGALTRVLQTLTEEKKLSESDSLSLLRAADGRDGPEMYTRLEEKRLDYLINPKYSTSLSQYSHAEQIQIVDALEDLKLKGVSSSKIDDIFRCAKK